jgi:hypothetical protein
MLHSTLQNADAISPRSSRAEALMLLLNAAASIGDSETRHVYQQLLRSCLTEKHWRCQRAIKDATAIIKKAREPQIFFT